MTEHSIVADFTRGSETAVQCTCRWQSEWTRSGLMAARAQFDEHVAEQSPMTPAEWLLVGVSCQFGNEFPGPFAWMCRRAWVTLVAGRSFDTDAAIAEHQNWLNRPANADIRRRLVDRIEFLRRCAAKPPLWQLPENLFNPDDWFTPQEKP